MKINLVSVKDGLLNIWKELQKGGSIQRKRIEVKINNQDEAIQKNLEVKNVLKEYGLNEVKVEHVFDQKKGAEFTLRGTIPITTEMMKAYRLAMDKIDTLGLKFFYSQEIKGGKLALSPLYPYGFGKLKVVN